MSVAEFQKLHEEMEALRKAGKMEETFAICTEDCYMMTPLGDPFGVKDAMKVAKHPKLESYMKAESKPVVDDVKVIGDLAIDRGHFEMKHPDGDQKGSYLILWKKEGGKWKCASACWNLQIITL